MAYLARLLKCLLVQWRFTLYSHSHTTASADMHPNIQADFSACQSHQQTRRKQKPLRYISVLSLLLLPTYAAATDSVAAHRVQHFSSLSSQAATTSSQSAFTALVQSAEQAVAPANQSLPNNAYGQQNRAAAPCQHCHQQQSHDWLASDHAHAMAKANPQTVLGDFNHAQAQHRDLQAQFFRRNGQFWVALTQPNIEPSPQHMRDSKLSTVRDTTTDTDRHDIPREDAQQINTSAHPAKTTATADTQHYHIKYSFGFYPLQQYLVETERGQFQVLPFAWDSRPQEQGGQRWFVLYPEQNIDRADRLHWLQPLHNWNGMCAECHSDALQKRYQPATDSFATQWQGINVGCYSCHGDLTEHSQAPTHFSAANQPMRHSNQGQWQRKTSESVARWQGPPRDNSFMQTCFACHALRAPLQDGFRPDKQFLDQFSPRLPNPPLYFADGQIDAEVYVYGSFMQSKMAQAGVNCLDCHQAHTMKLKVEGNALCLQCHSAEYNQPPHLLHQGNIKEMTDTDANLCVSCHMPQRRYMGVDNRRDHSFVIPRPELTAHLNLPNPCQQCHHQSAQWLAEKITQYYPGRARLTATEQLLLTLRSGQPISPAAHRQIIMDSQLPAINRASALELLPQTHNRINGQWLQPLLHDPDPLLRQAAATQGGLLSAQARQQLLTPLLQDPISAVRIAAARVLQPPQATPAAKELAQANAQSAWRAEGRINQARQLLANGLMDQAITTLQSAILIDPFFAASYIHLAELYRHQEQLALSAQTLHQGLKHNPESAALHYATGLQAVRHHNWKTAEQALLQAVILSKQQPQYLLVYLMTLQRSGKAQQALNYLNNLPPRTISTPQLKKLQQQLQQTITDKSPSGSEQ